MKIFKTFFYICILSLASKAQPKALQDYKKYHTQIIEAETYISTEDYDHALAIYEKVFDAYDFVFVRDYKIATQCALHLNQKEKAIELIKKGIAAGWRLKDIKKRSYLSKLRREPEWQSIKETYPELRKTYLDCIDQHMREKVYGMFKKDQKMALGAFLRIRARSKQNYALEKFAPHSEAQVMQLIDILASSDYPGERLIGNNFWMSTILSHHNSIDPSFVKADTLYHVIKPKLMRALATGYMSPYEYALISDWRKAVSFERQVGYGFLKPPQQVSLAETNSLRGKIGLRSIELRNSLVDIENKTGMNLYLPNWIEGKIYILHE